MHTKPKEDILRFVGLPFSIARRTRGTFVSFNVTIVYAYKIETPYHDNDLILTL
jgi:hypothetical protein